MPMKLHTRALPLVGLVGLLLGLGACRSRGTAGATAAVTGEDTRAVYEAVLREAYTHDGVKRLVVDPDLHWIGDDMVGLYERPRGVPHDAWRAWITRARRGGKLPRELTPGVEVHWFTNREVLDLPTDGSIEAWWPAFHERFPDSSGHIQLSRIGFSADGRSAVVYGWVGSGSLSASGDLFLLRRTEAGWRMVATHNFAMA